MRETVLIPVGCIESHGLLPDDTDTLIAKAFCRLVSQKLALEVAKPLSHGFCPNTHRLPGTEARSFAEVFHSLKETAASFIDRGRQYIIFINIHNGNDAVLKSAIQDIFIQRSYPIMYFNPYSSFAARLDNKYFGNKDNNVKEISLLQASLEILGLDIIRGPRQDQEQRRDPLLERLKKKAVVGFSYTEAAQHIAWRKGARVLTGKNYLKEVSELFEAVLEDFKTYVDSILGARNG